MKDENYIPTLTETILTYCEDNRYTNFVNLIKCTLELLKNAQVIKTIQKLSKSDIERYQTLETDLDTILNGASKSTESYPENYKGSLYLNNYETYITIQMSYYLVPSGLEDINTYFSLNCKLISKTILTKLENLFEPKNQILDITAKQIIERITNSNTSMHCWCLEFKKHREQTNKLEEILDTEIKSIYIQPNFKLIINKYDIKIRNEHLIAGYRLCKNEN